MLVPQALEGVAAVALLYAAIKRWFGAGAGLLAGTLLAITPVAALMFRFNNPDALLVCLLVASAVLPDQGDREGGHQVGDHGRDDDRLRVPGEDDAGVPRAARVRAGLPGGGPHRTAPASGATARRCAGDRRQLRLVGGDRGAVAGELASVDRRLARQQHLQFDLRLQRPRADLRLRAAQVGAVVRVVEAARASAERPGCCACSTN